MKNLSEKEAKIRALYDFHARSPISSVLNETGTGFLVETDQSQVPIKIDDYIKIFDKVWSEEWNRYEPQEKKCLVSQGQIGDAWNFVGNCSLESVEFWNRVVPNVDVPYECHQPEPVEVRIKIQYVPP